MALPESEPVESGSDPPRRLLPKRLSWSTAETAPGQLRDGSAMDVPQHTLAVLGSSVWQVRDLGVRKGETSCISSSEAVLWR